MTAINRLSAQRAVTLLTRFFPGRLPQDTISLFADELVEQGFADDDVAQGVRLLAHTSQHPSLAELLTCIRQSRETRSERERTAIRPVAGLLMEPVTDVRGTRLRMNIIRDIFERLMPDGDYGAELRIRLQMSDEEIEARRRDMQAMRRGTSPTAEETP